MEDKRRLMDEINTEVAVCTACGLCEGRTNAVPGEGALDARVMVIGEGPGANEDREGRPFVGKAGQLLELMLDSIGLRRDDVFIGNIVKCRPPQNRAPKDDEAKICMPFLDRQVEIIQPEFLLLMGATALQQYVSKDLRITKIRGQWLEKDGRDVIATFHPAALLRDPNKKPLSFEDMLELKRALDSR